MPVDAVSGSQFTGEDSASAVLFKPFWAAITDVDASTGQCAWTQQLPVPLGVDSTGFHDMPGGGFGTTVLNPIVAVLRVTNAPKVGDIVLAARAYFDPTLQWVYLVVENGSGTGGGGGSTGEIKIARVDADGQVIALDENGDDVFNFYDATEVKFSQDPALIATPTDVEKVWLYSADGEEVEKTHYYPAKDFGKITLNVNGVDVTRPLLVLAENDVDIIKVTGAATSDGVYDAIVESYHLGSPMPHDGDKVWLSPSDGTTFQVGDITGGLPNGNFTSEDETRPLYIGLPRGPQSVVEGSCNVRVDSVLQPGTNITLYTVSWKGLQVFGGTESSVGCGFVTSCDLPVANTNPTATKGEGDDAVTFNGCDFTVGALPAFCQGLGLAGVQVFSNGFTGTVMITYLDPFCLQHTLTICVLRGLIKNILTT